MEKNLFSEEIIMKTRKLLATSSPYEEYIFRFNMEQGTISVWVGDGNCVDYVNTANAVG